MKPVRLNVSHFIELSQLLTIAKYKEVEISETPTPIKNFYRKVFRDKSQKHPETAFVFKKEGVDYVAYVWTSFVKSLGKFRDTGLDYIWCIIVDLKTDKIAYCSEPYKRSAKDCILRVGRRAWVNMYKIVHIPDCPECKKQMQIYQNFETNETMFVCKNRVDHKIYKNVYQGWDENLPPKADDFVKQERVPRAQYRAKNKKLGKTPMPRRKRRRVWVKPKESPKRE